MQDTFPKVAIVVTAFVYVGFAVWLGSAPAALLGAFQIEQPTPQMLTEIRAFYGGVELGIAFSMFILLWRYELFAAAIVGGLPLAGSVLGRLSGQLLDGYSLLHLGRAIPEAIGAITCFTACWQTRSDPLTSGKPE